MFKPGDRVRNRRYPDVTYEVKECSGVLWRTASSAWLPVDAYELAEPTISVTHLRQTLFGLRATEPLTIRRKVIENVYKTLTGEDL